MGKKLKLTATEPQVYQTHRIAEIDRERIRCRDCNGPTDISVHGNPTGFYYYCTPCYEASGYFPYKTYEYIVHRYTLVKENITVYANRPISTKEADEFASTRHDPYETTELVYQLVEGPTGIIVKTFGTKDNLPEHRRNDYGE